MSLLTYIFLLPMLTALLIVLIPRNYRFVIRSLALLATFASLILAVTAFCNVCRSASAVAARSFGVDASILVPSGMSGG